MLARATMDDGDIASVVPMPLFHKNMQHNKPLTVSDRRTLWLHMHCGRAVSVLVHQSRSIARVAIAQGPIPAQHNVSKGKEIA
jgi:hypothetical protein